VLYGLDSHGPDWPEGEQELSRAVARHLALREPEELGPEARELAGELVRGVVGEREAVDRVLLRAAANWRLERMSRVDRNILRLATYELMVKRDIPPAVVLNEAIEIAKAIGSTESAAFVNGVLDRVRRDLGR
jgi:N utilization substance protein B